MTKRGPGSVSPALSLCPDPGPQFAVRIVRWTVRRTVHGFPAGGKMGSQYYPGPGRLQTRKRSGRPRSLPVASSPGPPTVLWRAFSLPMGVYPSPAPCDVSRRLPGDFWPYSHGSPPSWASARSSSSVMAAMISRVFRSAPTSRRSRKAP